MEYRPVFIRSSLLQALVDGFHKHIRRPPWDRTVQRIIVARGAGGLDLLERHSLLDHVLDSIANDDGHLAAVQHIAKIGKTSVAGNDQRAALLAINRNDHVDEPVQSVDYSLYASACRQIDHRIAVRGKN